MRLEVIQWKGSAAPQEKSLRDQLERNGFDVFRWSDAAGADYPPHSHDHDESLWVVGGEISFGIAGKSYPLRAGDRLMLPRGTVHTAKAGPAGATYLIGQRQG
jgi:quercetin dioxygenase-like cupin family protein